jgi:hypothetical protein
MPGAPIGYRGRVMAAERGDAHLSQRLAVERINYRTEELTKHQGLLSFRHGPRALAHLDGHTWGRGQRVGVPEDQATA